VEAEAVRCVSVTLRRTDDFADQRDVALVVRKLARLDRRCAAGDRDVEQEDR
jgi:hypothetical protein